MRVSSILVGKKWIMRMLVGFAILWSITSCGDSSSSSSPTPPLTAGTLDNRPFPAWDYNRANRIPAEMTGYWTKSFTVDNVTRTAKVYIPKETPIRSYYTIIAVPNGVDTSVFIQDAGWKAMADSNGEGLFILEPGSGGWGSYDKEINYVTAAISFYTSNKYFSVFGEHYFVGYGAGAPALEAWAVANPLKVISQVYIDSSGLPQSYIDTYANVEFGGANGTYVTIPFPTGFTKIQYKEAVLPTWFIHPGADAAASIAYWKAANDCAATGTADTNFGTVFSQKTGSTNWMTSNSGPISKVAVREGSVSYTDTNISKNIQNFMFYYTRYENAVAYGNQLSVRANYTDLGIEIKTITVNTFVREFMVYKPAAAATIWGEKAPVLFVFPGDSQTDRVFLDATQWWQVAKDKGFVLVIICEQYNTNSSVTVSHKDTTQFYLALKDYIAANYKVDTTRFYATGQSAGSMASMTFGVAKPEYFAAIASTSGTPMGWTPSGGTITMDGVTYPNSNKPIPTYLIVGAGDINMFNGSLFDATSNSLDTWAAYHLANNGFALGDGSNNVVSGWKGRFTDWTWTKNIGGVNAPLFKTGLNAYRSHNCIAEEMPKLWDFLKYYSREVDGTGNVIRYYSPSGFMTSGDKIRIN